MAVRPVPALRLAMQKAYSAIENVFKSQHFSFSNIVDDITRISELAGGFQTFEFSKIRLFDLPKLTLPF